MFRFLVPGSLLPSTHPVFTCLLFTKHATMPNRCGCRVLIRSLLRPISPAKHAAVTDQAPSRQGFTRGNTKSNQNLKAQYNNGQAQSPVSQQAPPLPPLTNSPSISSTFSEQNAYIEQPKRFLDERYAKCSVKGNFLTLAAQPKNVELGEWLAHQCGLRDIYDLTSKMRLISCDSGRDEPTPNGHDSSHPRGRY